MAAAVETEGQKYIAEHGPPSTPEKEEEEKQEVKVLGHWNGKGRLAAYETLEPKLCQRYRLFGEECMVVGCTRRVNAPKYVMELIGAPTCMECGQKIGLQQLKGGTFEFEYEKPTAAEIEKCRQAGVTVPAWGE